MIEVFGIHFCKDSLFKNTSREVCMANYIIALHNPTNKYQIVKVRNPVEIDKKLLKIGLKRRGVNLYIDSQRKSEFSKFVLKCGVDVSKFYKDKSDFL